MATIDSKKLLSSSKESSAIEKPKFLVPFKSISVKKITGSDLKPVDKTGTDEPGNLVVVKKKIVSLSKIINNNLLLDQKEASTKRKEEEKSKREKKEKDLEQKVKKNNIKPDLIGSIPGQSIFDKINRFIGFTLLGYLFNQYGELLPKLMEFGKVLEPVGKFVEGFAKNILKGVVDFVEFGYKAYDQTRDFVKQIGGEGAQKTFDDFSKNLNLLLNGAIGAAMLIASTSPGKPRSGPGGRRGGDWRTEGNVIKGKGGFKEAYDNMLKKGNLTEGEKRVVRDYKRLVKAGYHPDSAANTAFGRNRPEWLSGRNVRGGGFSVETAKDYRTAARGNVVNPKLSLSLGKGVFGRVPIVGGLIDFAFSLAMGENPGRAAAKAVGSTIGSALGTFIPVPFAGTILGGILGDIVGGAMYDTLVGNKQKPQAKAQGGSVTRGGQSSVAPSRKLKTGPKKTAPKIQSQKTQPGKDVGGKLKIEELYGTDEPGKRSALRALKRSSEDVKKMRSINGLTGAMFGAGIDMSLGQKPDKKLARSIGDVFGSVVQNAVNAELSNSFGDISRSIAMASGGVVPTREIGSGLSIGERIGKFISSALAISIESSASRIIQNLNRELNLEGGPPGGNGGAPPGEVPPAEISEDQRKASTDLIKYFEKLYGKNAAIGIVANLLRESGLRTRTPDNSSFEGMAQWSRNDRWPKFVSWAQSKGKDPYSRSAQAEWIAIELKQLGTDARLKKAESAEAAASIFYNEFERAAYSKPILGNKYNPDNPHERKNRAFVSSLQGGSMEYVPPGKYSPVVSGKYGEMRSTGRHGGTDLSGIPVGTPLRAISDGKIIESGFESGWGNYTVFIDKNGIYHLYGHMKSRGKASGQIKKGDVIGYVGMTGRTTGPHLHWETGTGWNGTITGSFDPLDRYNRNAPFNTGKEAVSPTKKDKPSDMFNWKQSSIAPNQPTSTSVAFANDDIGKTDTSNTIYYNSAVAFQPIEIPTPTV